MNLIFSRFLSLNHALIICALSLGLMPDVLGHARFKLGSGTPPRTDATGLKVAPCGGVPRSEEPQVFKPGATIKVFWTETVQHPGRFIISFSEAGEQGFEDNVLMTIIDEQDDPATLPHEYSAEITLPDQTCEDCTLQLIQVMEENPDAPTNYYSCSDLRLTNEELPAEEAGSAEEGSDGSAETGAETQSDEVVAGDRPQGGDAVPPAPTEVEVWIYGKRGGR